MTNDAPDSHVPDRASLRPSAHGCSNFEPENTVTGSLTGQHRENSLPRRQRAWSAESHPGISARRIALPQHSTVCVNRPDTHRRRHPPMDKSASRRPLDPESSASRRLERRVDQPLHGAHTGRFTKTACKRPPVNWVSTLRHPGVDTPYRLLRDCATSGPVFGREAPNMQGATHTAIVTCDHNLAENCPTCLLNTTHQRRRLFERNDSGLEWQMDGYIVHSYVPCVEPKLTCQQYRPTAHRASRSRPSVNGCVQSAK